EALSRSADRYQRALGKLRQNGDASPAEASLKSVNEKLLESERAFTTEAGLPERPWFKHQIYAPGAYTGYGVKTIPAVRESIEEKQWKQADEQIARVGKVLENAGEQIQSAATALDKVTQGK